MKISAVIIVKNEEENIRECLSSLSWADEIIVIDNGSSDKTTSIARSMNAVVYQVPGLDFSYLRNYGKEKARNQWLLYIDADERISQDLAAEIRTAVEINEDITGFYLIRKNYFYAVSWPNKERMLRLINKDKLIGWQGSLHETAHVSGAKKQLSNELIHYTHENLTKMVIKTNEWSDIEAQLRYMNNHPPVKWWRFIRVIVVEFLLNFVAKKGFIKGTYGLIESLYQSFSIFISYAKLWEKQNRTISE